LKNWEGLYENNFKRRPTEILIAAGTTLAESSGRCLAGAAPVEVALSATFATA
jgi:hypothetical protein